MPPGSRLRVANAFTLIELLVVISIIALLLAILVPALSGSRAEAYSVKCKANLHMLGIGIVMYADANDGFVIPSYNLPPIPGSSANFTGGPQQPLDGWGPILDRDHLVPSNERDTRTVFYCPRTVDIEGVKDGQTGTDPNKPRGWTDWPLKFTTSGGDSSPKVPVTIPEWGFHKIIRVSYWINAYNPIGSAPASIAASDQHYTASIGLGPDSHGEYIRLHRTNSNVSTRLIVLSDGVYMGRQTVTRLGDTNSRIGYRHPGRQRPDGSANVASADGHVGAILADKFPRALTSSDPPELVEQKKIENFTGPTVYVDPQTVFP